ncbi:MAG: MFS transporter [Epsilonproteobacteria bacterium]|nr:MAG: MFS transporter [Campylobacterota bacterium]
MIFLSVFYFFYFACIGVFIIFLPKLLYELNWQTYNIGLIFAVVALMRFLSPFLFVKNITLNQQKLMYSLFSTTILSGLLLLTIDSFVLFLINNIFLGFTMSLILPYMENLAVKSLGKNNYGRSRMFGSIGFLLVAMFLPHFLSDINLVLHFFFYFVLFMSIFAYISLYHENFQKKPDETPSDKFSLLKHKYFWISLFLMQVSFGGFYNFFTIYESSYGIKLDIIGYLWAFGVLCEIIMLYFQGSTLKNNLLYLIELSIFATVIRWLILFLFPENLSLVFLSQAFHAFSFGLYHSSVVIYLYNLYQNKKLAQQFLFGIGYGLGGFVGAIGAGLVYGEYLFLYCAIVAIASLIFIWYYKSKELL